MVPLVTSPHNYSGRGLLLLMAARANRSELAISRPLHTYLRHKRVLRACDPLTAASGLWRLNTQFTQFAQTQPRIIRKPAAYYILEKAAILLRNQSQEAGDVEFHGRHAWCDVRNYIAKMRLPRRNVSLDTSCCILDISKQALAQDKVRGSALPTNREAL